MAIDALETSTMANMTARSAQFIQPAAYVAQNKKPEAAEAAPQYKSNQSEENVKEEYQIQDVDPEKVKEAIKAVNQKIKPTRTECQFSYHEETKRIAIKVLDQETGDVIREIPPEKTLDMIAKMWEVAGLLVDEKR